MCTHVTERLCIHFKNVDVRVWVRVHEEEEKKKKKERKGTGIIFDKAPVEVSQLVGGDVAAGVIGRLEVQVVFASLVELGGGDVHTNHNLVCVAGLGDGILQQLQS